MSTSSWNLGRTMVCRDRSSRGTHSGRREPKARRLTLCLAFLSSVLVGCGGSAAGAHSTDGGTQGTDGGTQGTGGAFGPFSSCPEPGTSYKHTYYSDPVNGSMSGDGSAAHPWGSLSAIVQAGLLPPAKGAVVQPGDAIELLSGNHGDVHLSADNPDYITIKAASGQTPLLSTLTLNSGSHWVIEGLTFQHLNAGGYDKAATLNANDIVFSGNTLMSQPDVSAWTQADWRQKGLFQAVLAGGDCIVIANNDIANVRFGIAVGGSHILVRGNTIDHFGDDGIDFAQGSGTGTISDVAILNNTITNNLDIGDSNHNDGMQGWVLNGTVGRNITIDSNLVIGKQDPALPWPGGMQGISEFDGDWTNIQITNNVVVAGAYHGIAMYGAEDSSIINNSVYGNFTAPNGDVNQTWIGVFNNKGGTPPSNVVVRNNVTSVLSLVNTGVTADHNTVAMDPTGLFVKFDRTICSYDFHPASGSALLGAGSPDMAPSHDITGKARTGPITVGAYQ